MTGAVASRAGDVAALAERRAKALARQLHQTETRNLAHLHPRAVVTQRFAQAVLHLALVALVLHVDEIDDDQAAQVAQPQLAGNLVSGLGVGVVRGLLDVVPFCSARRVDVDRNERLGMVDHHRAAGRERYLARVRGLDLMLDLEAREKGHVVAVTLRPPDVVGHDVAHERHRLLEDRIGVDQDLADVGLEVVADGADDEAAFLVDQEGGRVEELALGVACRLGRFDDLAPELEQIGQGPLQLFVRTADSGGAADDAHPGRNVELVHDLAQLVSILALDAARHAAAARIVRHQHEIAPGETDEGRERSTLVAALVLLDLDDQLLAFGYRVLDASATDVDAGFEKLLRDFLEGKKSVAFGAVIHERGFEAGLDPRDDALVDVAFSLLFCGRFDVEVYEFLTVDDRDTEFLGLCRIEKHALHCFILPRARAGQTKRLICRLASHHRFFDHENAVNLLVGFDSLECRTVNSADMLLARASISITSWRTNRLCRLLAHALVNKDLAVGSVGTGDRVASLVSGQKMRPSHVQAPVPQRKQRPDHKQNEGFKQRSLGRGRFREQRAARRQLPDAGVQGGATQPRLPHPAHRPGEGEQPPRRSDLWPAAAGPCADSTGAPGPAHGDDRAAARSAGGLRG